MPRHWIALASVAALLVVTAGGRSRGGIPSFADVEAEARSPVRTVGGRRPGARTGWPSLLDGPAHSPQHNREDGHPRTRPVGRRRSRTGARRGACRRADGRHPLVGGGRGYPPREPGGTTHRVPGYELAPRPRTDGSSRSWSESGSAGPAALDRGVSRSEYRAEGVPYRATFDDSLWLCTDPDERDGCIDPDR